jgi:hypothetical protein
MSGALRRLTGACALSALLLLASCPNPLMSAIAAKEAGDTSKTVSAFTFTASANAKLYRDVHAAVDAAAHTITLSVPKWVPLTDLVATFQFQGASVTVGGVPQASGVTANDFSHSVTYTVAPASGTPVTYAVTATTGSQGLMGGVIQGTPLVLSGSVTTVAGLASSFGNPMGIARVGSSIYIADAQFSVIWHVNANSGAVTLYAGILGQPGFADASGTSAQFNTPVGLATDGTKIYVADQANNRIRKIDSTGNVTTLAGTGALGHVDSTPGPATFDGPNGLYYDSGSSLLYETDKVSKIVRTVSLTGTVSTIVPFGNTIFAAPAGLVLYNTNLYVTDEANGAVYEIGPGPTYTEVGGMALSTGFSVPIGIVAYNSQLYVADSGNHSIQQVDPVSGTLTLFAGTGVSTGFGHVDGLNPLAMRLDTPNMIWVQAGSPTYMYVTEGGNTDIRSILLNAIPATDIGSTLAGVPPGNANGSGSAARLYSPRQMASNGSTVWFGDQLNQLLRSMDLTTGSVGTVAGEQGNAMEQDGTGGGAAFNYPAGMTTDGKSLFVCDQYGQTIRRVDIATGAVTTIAGSNGAALFLDAVGTAARFNRPTGITTDGSSLYVCDLNNNDVRRIDLASLQVTTIAGSLTQVAVDADGTGNAATFKNPNAVTTDGTNLYVTEASNEKIRKIVITTRDVTTIAGPPPGTTTAGYVNAVGTAARFRTPVGITTDGTFLYVADQNNDVIRQIDIASGAVSTLAGAAQPLPPPPLIEAAAEIDGIGAAARFNFPIGITTDGVSLYVTDRGSNVIRRIQ